MTVTGDRHDGAAVVTDTLHLLTPDEVAERLKLPRRSIRRLGIDVVVLGPKTFRYEEEAVRRYIESRRKDAA